MLGVQEYYSEAFKYGPNFGDLCELMVDEMQEMCRAQQRVLQSCPEFTNHWCYQDLAEHSSCVRRVQIS